MSRKEKKKLCWNCEGDVPRSVGNCPYCGVYIHPSDDSDDDDDDLVISPPYQLNPDRKDNEEVPVPPYAVKENIAKDPSEITKENGTVDRIQQVLIPLVTLLVGSVFLLFGLVLWLFSDKERLIVTWEIKYWPFYLFLSIPLLFFGWKKLEQLSDD